MGPPRTGRLVCWDSIERKRDLSCGEQPCRGRGKAAVETESDPSHKGAQRCLYFDRFLEVEWVKNSGKHEAA